jgi:hypothetical protein
MLVWFGVVWCGLVWFFLTDNNTTPKKVVLSCLGLLVGLLMGCGNKQGNNSV